MQRVQINLWSNEGGRKESQYTYVQELKVLHVTLMDHRRM
jgi:hypothetical protein